jgi:hypothetical protein
MAEPDVGFGVAGLARQIGGNAAGTERDGQDDDTCGIIRLLLLLPLTASPPRGGTVPVNMTKTAKV